MRDFTRHTGGVGQFICGRAQSAPLPRALQPELPAIRSFALSTAPGYHSIVNCVTAEDSPCCLSSGSTKNHETIVRDLADLVAIQSISTDGEHSPEIERTAELTCEQMREAGLAERRRPARRRLAPLRLRRMARAPGKPTVFLYAHHDVQPINYREQWQTDPWKLTRRDGRLFGRGSADDKGAITAQLGADRRLPEDRAASCRSTSRCWSRARRRSARRT